MADHFRGFEAYWEVDAKEETAINGTWKKGPGEALFRAIQKELGEELRNACNGIRVAVLVDLEQMPVGPHVGPVWGHEDGNVSDNGNIPVVDCTHPQSD